MDEYPWRNRAPLTNIKLVEMFDCWGIGFVGPFSESFGHIYVLVAIDYVSKWVEANVTQKNNSTNATIFLEYTLFLKFEALNVIISN